MTQQSNSLRKVVEKTFATEQERYPQFRYWDDMPDRVVAAIERALHDAGLTPPDGWFTFGSHADLPLALEFSEELGADGLPLWERPVPGPHLRDIDPEDLEAIAELLRENAQFGTEFDRVLRTVAYRLDGTQPVPDEAENL